MGKKTQRKRSEEIRGANAPLISTNKPRIRGQDVANWPHPGGDMLYVGFCPLLSSWICYLF